MSGLLLSTMYVINSRHFASGGLPPACGVSGGNLESVSSFVFSQRLPFNRKLELSLHNNTRFNSWVGMARNFRSRVQRYVRAYRCVTRDRAVNLRQNFARNPGRRLRILCRGIGRDEPRKSTNRARCEASKTSSCQHICVLPSAPGIIGAPDKCWRKIRFFFMDVSECLVNLDPQLLSERPLGHVPPVPFALNLVELR